jgi:hypothetical protein
VQIKGHGAKLPRKQGEAIAALLLCDTVEKAAKHIHVAPSTLFRWLQAEGFKKDYREAKATCVSQAIGRLQQTCSEAVDTLRTIMLDQDKPASTRVQAAKIILETSIKGVELEEMDERIEKLEQYVDARIKG